MSTLTAALVAAAAERRARILTGFEPAWPGALAVGRALTVRAAPGDNLALHRAVDAVEPGEIVVVDAGGELAAAQCGDLIALAAQRRGAAGLVVNGPIRDRSAIAELAFPVFHRGTSTASPAKEEPGELRVPVLGIEPGDLVVADADGVVAVPARDADAVLTAAEALAAREDELRARIRAGESTLDLLGLRERRR